MDAQTKSRLSKYLQQYSCNIDTLSKGEAERLEKLDEVIQKHLSNIQEASETIKENACSQMQIFTEAGIPFKVFKSSEILRNYVGSRVSETHVLTVPAETVERLTCSIDTVNNKIKMGEPVHIDDEDVIAITKIVNNLNDQLNNQWSSSEDTTGGK